MMIRSLVVLFALAAGILVLPDAQAIPVAPAGYTWSANITKPAPVTPVNDFLKGVYGGRTIYSQLAPGNYDVATVPFSDNWSCPAAGAYKSIKLAKSSNISVMAKFPKDEPSCGHLILIRGPYADGAAESDRSFWMANSMPGGMVRPKLSFPVYAHSGARYDRYGVNGYRWTEFGGYPIPPLGIGQAWGAKKLYAADRMPITPCVTAPDVTILSSIPSPPILVAYSIVDMLGRETPISDPVALDACLFPSFGSVGIVSRNGAAPMGSCGFHVYAGTSATDLHRQPVLNCIGHDDQYLWPLWLQQFLIHDLRTDTPVPEPSATVSSLLNQPQCQVVAGLNTIVQTSKNYGLYCPFILHYDPANFGRDFTGKATYTHKTDYPGQTETAIPMLLIQNQRDRPRCMSFVSDKAIAGAAVNDYSGGQAFGTILERCSFQMLAWDSYGFIVDERSSWQFGGHIASETQFRDCRIIGAIPVKIEGNQSAKFRFFNCEFGALGGNTSYPADTVGIGYIQTGCQVRYEGVEGVNGAFRSLVCLCPTEGPSNVSVTDCFCDGGCPVYFTFAGYLGGKATLNNGNINAVLPWARLVEAPSSLGAIVKLNDAGINPYVSSFSAQLNQLAIESDVPFGEVVAPTESSWLANGLLMQWGTDFSKKKQLRYTSGFSIAVESFIVTPTVLP